MTKIPHNYAAIVQQHQQQKARGQITAAYVVHANAEHWRGYADAGASLALAVSQIAAPYQDRGVNPKSVAREFNRIHGSWKHFRKDGGRVFVSAVPSGPLPLTPSLAVSAPILNDDRPTGGYRFGE